MMPRVLAEAAVLIAAVMLVPAALAAPPIEHWISDNGLRVYFIRTPELPMVDIELVFDAGSARDGARPGVARLTAGLLDEGARDWNADDIARRFEEVGAEYSASANRDMSVLSLRSLTDPEFFGPALDTYLQVVTRPTFPSPDLDRLKRLTLVSIRHKEQNPSDVGEKAFYQALYRDHPFAHPVIGTRESVQAIDRGDIERFYRQFYVARNALLAMVGDISRGQAEGIAARIGAGLRSGAAAVPLPPVGALESGELIRIPFPSEQAHIYIGQPGMRRGDPDYFSLYVGNHILGGGGFSSRLVKEVRVDRGLSYSVYSYFLPQRVEGPFQLGLQTREDKADAAAAVARRTLVDFIRDGPTDKELDSAVKNITGGFPMRIDSNADLVGYMAVIGFYGLPLDYMDAFPAKVEAVTRGSIRSAFRRRLHPDRMVTVMVGGEAKAP